MVHGHELGAAAARRLAELGCCTIAPGLTDAEFDRIEHEYGVTFADDHRAFLAAGLPVRDLRPGPPGAIVAGAGWPDWRHGDPDRLRAMLDWPAEGVLGDVADGEWWLDEWGGRPADPAAAVEVVRGLIAAAPRMVPVFGHRYLPAGRGTAGHAVLSIYGHDVIRYGMDLRHYVDQEFQRPPPGWPPNPPPTLTAPFWRDLP